jgi:hypothetical protein
MWIWDTSIDRPSFDVTYISNGVNQDAGSFRNDKKKFILSAVMHASFVQNKRNYIHLKTKMPFG